MAAEIIIKIFLITANFIFVIVGGGLVTLGVLGELKIHEIHNVSIASYQTVPIVMIVVGAIVFLIAFFGCCGAISESNFMLSIYAIFMVILLIVNAIVGVLIFAKPEMLVDYEHSFQNELFKQDRNSFTVIESWFKCCGPAGRKSYDINVPATCCNNPPCLLEDEMYPGCDVRAKNIINSNTLYIGAASLFIAGLELVGAAMSLWLASLIRRNNKHEY